MGSSPIEKIIPISYWNFFYLFIYFSLLSLFIFSLIPIFTHTPQESEQEYLTCSDDETTSDKEAIFKIINSEIPITPYNSENSSNEEIIEIRNRISHLSSSQATKIYNLEYNFRRKYDKKNRILKRYRIDG